MASSTSSDATITEVPIVGKCESTSFGMGAAGGATITCVALVFVAIFYFIRRRFKKSESQSMDVKEKKVEDNEEGSQLEDKSKFGDKKDTRRKTEDSESNMEKSKFKESKLKESKIKESKIKEEKTKGRSPKSSFKESRSPPRSKMKKSDKSEDSGGKGKKKTKRRR